MSHHTTPPLPHHHITTPPHPTPPHPHTPTPPHPHTPTPPPHHDTTTLPYVPPHHTTTTTYTTTTTTPPPLPHYHITTPPHYHITTPPHYHMSHHTTICPTTPHHLYQTTTTTTPPPLPHHNITTPPRYHMSHHTTTPPHHTTTTTLLHHHHSNPLHIASADIVLISYTIFLHISELQTNSPGSSPASSCSTAHVHTSECVHACAGGACVCVWVFMVIPVYAHKTLFSTMRFIRLSRIISVIRVPELVSFQSISLYMHLKR